MAALRTIPGVELAKVGTWATSTMLWTCTAEQLADAVRAAQDPAFRDPVLKLGHVDDRFDGEPAVGRITNLRTSPDGQTLIGDYADMPAWLADIVEVAYPSRSVEMNLDVVTAAGGRYAAVLTGLALLGVVAPAIESLADLAARYEQPTTVDDWVAASAVAANALTAPTWPRPGDARTPMAPLAAAAPTVPSAHPPEAPVPTTDPTPTPAAPAPDPAPPNGSGPGQSRAQAGWPVRAAASMDDLRTAFYEWRDQNSEPDQPAAVLDDWSWICEVWTDRLIVDDEDGRLWCVNWTETNGTFTFEPPVRVTRTYVPVADTVAARAQADMVRPVRFDRGRVDASASTLEAPVVSNPILAQMREKLGLGAEVDDDAVLAAAVEKLTAPQPTPPADPAPTPTTPAGPAATDGTDTPVDVERLVEERVAAATAKFGEQLEAATTELATIRASKAAEHKTAVLAAAQRAGKFAPADLEKWSTDYDAAPTVVESVLSRMAPGTAVPVLASSAGVVGSEPASADDEAVYAEMRNVFQLAGGE